MFGKIFITRTGYDPEKGRQITDPYLGDSPSVGACRPDIRRRLTVGDHLFVISGKIRPRNGEPVAPQFVVGGLEVAEKIDTREAYERYPEQRLHLDQYGNRVGNVVIDATGAQHPLDDHRRSTFSHRLGNYVVGTNQIVLATPDEISLGREESLEILREILDRKGDRPIELVGRSGASLSEKQISRLRDWLASVIKRSAA